MSDQPPPPWGSDRLYNLFADAELNERVSSQYLPVLYARLQRVNEVFRCVLETVEQDDKSYLLYSRFLITRTYGSFFAAIRVAMGGQIIESFPLLRSAIEQAWYALHMAMDPNPPGRITVWKNRNQDDASKKKCIDEFLVAKVRSTHEDKDPKTAKELHALYEFLIDFGGHPNPRGVLGTVIKTEKGHGVGVLYPDEDSLVETLKVAIRVAVGTLKVFQLIYSKRFELMNLDLRITELANETIHFTAHRSFP